MKNIKAVSNWLILTVTAALLVSGCRKTSDKNVFSEYDIVDQNSQAFIKVNYNVAFYNNPLVQLKINGTRVSGTNIQTRYPFPGGGFNTLGGSTGDYLPVTPGSAEVSLSIPKKGTNIDSLNIYTTKIATTAGKRYSLHVTDSLVRKSLLVEEDASLPDSGFVRYRFVNLMPNVPALDLYLGTDKVMSNVAFLNISDKFTLPTSAAVTSTTWTIRAAGALPTSTPIATYTSSSTILNQRVYTVFATGYFGYNVATTTEPRRPFVSFYYVR